MDVQIRIILGNCLDWFRVRRRAQLTGWTICKIINGFDTAGFTRRGTIQRRLQMSLFKHLETFAHGSESAIWAPMQGNR